VCRCNHFCPLSLLTAVQHILHIIEQCTILEYFFQNFSNFTFFSSFYNFFLILQILSSFYNFFPHFTIFPTSDHFFVILHKIFSSLNNFFPHWTLFSHLLFLYLAFKVHCCISLFELLSGRLGKDDISSRHTKRHVCFRTKRSGDRAPHSVRFRGL
jgi:hypothetical protein